MPRCRCRSRHSSGRRLDRYAVLMLAANVWHWWIGVVLTVVSLLTVAALGGGYLKQVTANRYPGRRQRRGHDEG